MENGLQNKSAHIFKQGYSIHHALGNFMLLLSVSDVLNIFRCPRLNPHNVLSAAFSWTKD
jgi:hypothetical protein